MKHASLALVSIALLASPLPAQEEPATGGETAPAIPAVASTETEKLLGLEGELVRVTGRVAETRTSPSGHQFLDFAESDFMTVTFRTDLDEFGDALPADTYEGKTVAITGPIKIYKGIPEIILNKPALIEIIEAAEAVVPPEPEPEPGPEPEPQPTASEPPVEEKEAIAEKKPPVDWRKYFPDPGTPAP